jgi:heme-degrading monooxygenase HmoA
MYAVIFTAQLGELDQVYFDTIKRMRELAQQEYGCLKFLSLSEGNHEVSISYWETQEHIQRWKENTEHLQAQVLGKSKWYKSYQVDIVKVIRQYENAT